MKVSNFEILLIYPGERVEKPRIPVSVLALATRVIAEGLSCRIVDERVEELSESQIKAAALIGISTMSGLQLKSAIKTAKRIRRIQPRLPLVWGGVHPTSFPEQTAMSPLVDFVVKGEGEEVFFKLINRIKANEDCATLPAITFRRDGLIINNPVSSDFIEMDKLHYPQYELLDIKKYADYTDGLSYETSRGCPFRCSFCYVETFHNRKWRGKSAEKVNEEMRFIKTSLGVKKIFIIDDNFFCDKKRVLEICSRMISDDIYFKWSATSRADFISEYSNNEMALLSRSGCEILAIGAESGSRRILSEIKKDITPEQIEIAVKKCVANGIMPTVSFIIGFPFETREDLEDTLDLYNRIMSVGKNVEVNGIFLYVPYVGTPLFQVSQQYGYEPKKTLEEWSLWNFSDVKNNIWLTGKRRKELVAISAIARFVYLRHRFEFYSQEFRNKKLKSLVLKLGYFLLVKIYAIMADFRWKRRFFSFAYEWDLWQKLTYTIFRVK
jgi:radical SAM superfamily enzyme YgiQ (UPF0313 family)